LFTLVFIIFKFIDFRLSTVDFSNIYHFIFSFIFRLKSIKGVGFPNSFLFFSLHLINNIQYHFLIKTLINITTLSASYLSSKTVNVSIYSDSHIHSLFPFPISQWSTVYSTYGLTIEVVKGLGLCIY